MFAFLKKTLHKTREKLSSGIQSIFARGKIDETLYEELEALLIESDLGVTFSETLLKKLKKSGLKEKHEIIHFLKSEIETALKNSAKKFELANNNPNIILVFGVNGSGKTTSIAKLGAYITELKESVAFVAADTFRAAAVEQLETWGKRLNINVYKGTEKQDPSSVIYQSIEKAKKDNIKNIIIDTAGRLHNKIELMDELKKMVRVIQKIDEKAPHEVILVLDATTGGNILTQVQLFSEIISISGIIMTKLDGTAKGGILVNVSELYKIPIYFIGTGEKQNDFDAFDPSNFAKNLIEGV